MLAFFDDKDLLFLSRNEPPLDKFSLILLQRFSLLRDSRGDYPCESIFKLLQRILTSESPGGQLLSSYVAPRRRISPLIRIGLKDIFVLFLLISPSWQIN